MTPLKPLGFYRELGFADWNGPIADTVSTQACADEGKIVAYLRQGHLLVGVTFIERDVLSSEPKPICAPHWYTDGRWIWPKSLAYYVQTYHCRLPDDFVADLRAKNWVVPDESAIDFDQLELPRVEK